MHHLYRLTGLTTAFIRSTLTCGRPCRPSSASLRRLLPCFMSSDAVSPSEGPPAVKEAVGGSHGAPGRAAGQTGVAESHQGDGKVTSQHHSSTGSGVESQSVGDKNRFAGEKQEPGERQDPGMGRDEPINSCSSDGVGDSNNKIGVSDEAGVSKPPEGSSTEGATRDGSTSQTVSTAPKSTDQVSPVLAFLVH